MLWQCICLISVSFALSNRIKISKDCTNDTKCIIHGCCETLEYVLKLGNLNGTTISIENDQHLRDAHMLKYVHDMTLISNKNQKIKCQEHESGLYFLFSKNITFRDLEISECGADYTSTTVGFEINNYDGPFNISEAVRFALSRDINIINVTFTENKGLALAFYDCNGEINIKNCIFNENTNIGSPKTKGVGKIISGGGIHIEYSPCGVLHPFNCSYNSILKDYNHDSTINIVASQFYKNIAENSTVFVTASYTMKEQQHISFGMGGAISIYLLGDSARNNISIKYCTFIQNIAHWGGAVALSIRHQSNENSINFYENVFSNNSATYAGGAIRIHSYIEHNAKGTILVHFENLQFTKNQAIWGGAISIAGTTRLMYRDEMNYRDTAVVNCTFVNNTATVGFAVGLSTWDVNKDASGPGMSYRVIFVNSSFINNRFIYTEDKIVIGQGALYSDEVVIVFRGNNIFRLNDNTALAISSSSVNFEKDSFTLFENNTGNEGGAIAIYGNSWLRLMKKSRLVFRQNKASTKGGAIYYKFNGPPRVSFKTTQLQTSQCFLRYEAGDTPYDMWQTNITFIHNTASNWSGSSVFASTLQFCRMFKNSRDAKKALNWTFITYDSLDAVHPEVVTTPINITVNSSEWEVVPGLPFSPTARLLDEKQQSVYGTVEVEIEKSEECPVQLFPPNNRFLIRNNFRALQLHGKERSLFNFSLKTTSGQFIITKKFLSNLKECLPGFRPVNDKCKCMKDEYSDVLNCDSDGTVYLLKGKWGYQNSKTRLLETTVCPEYYCQCNSSVDSFKCKFNKNDQCAPGREGILCSRCKPGLSVKIGNEECGECSNLYLLLLIPAFVVLSILVIVTLCFNFDAFSGYLNAFLYSYQMMTMLIPENVQLDGFISLVIGITSLGGTGGAYGFCFFNGMDNLQKTAINYIIPSYMLLFTIFIGMVIPASMYQRFFYHSSNVESPTASRARSFGSALSFMLVISYSSFTKITFQFLNCVKIDGKSVMFRAAFAECFQHEHIWYGILAILIFIFIVLLFPVILLFTRNFTNRFQTIQRLEPIWNTLKDCFKDHALCRMFAAYYFICRLILLALNAFLSELVNRMVCVNIANIVFLVIFLSVQPYKNWRYNFWDTIILTDMCLISLLSLVVSTPYATSAIPSNVYDVILKIAVYLPFIIVVLRLLVYLKGKLMKGRPNDSNMGSHFGETKSKISGRIRRWRNRRKSLMRFPERVVEDFESDYVEFR